MNYIFIVYLFDVIIFFVFFSIILVKLKMFWLSKILGMPYNLEWREYLFVSSIYCQIYLGNSGQGQNTVLFDEQANDQLSFQKYYSLLVLS
jgi:hypothetical protein